MPLDLRERFGPKGALPQSSLAGDFRFQPSEIPALRDYRILQEEVDVLESPLAVDRLYDLASGRRQLKLELALSINGSVAAVDLLFRRLAAFQRDPEEKDVRDLAKLDGVGEVGVAWPWEGPDALGVVGFVRHNVVVMLQGLFEPVVQQARDLDAAISRTPTGDKPSMTEEPSFALGERASATPGGRLDLGLPMKSDERLFFITSGGSVNRDPNQPSLYYFRAGLTRGTQTVTVLRVGAGLVPARQTIRITIE
jgi:hypothetical protein